MALWEEAFKGTKISYYVTLLRGTRRLQFISGYNFKDRVPETHEIFLDLDTRFHNLKAGHIACYRLSKYKTKYTKNMSMFKRKDL